MRKKGWRRMGDATQMTSAMTSAPVVRARDLTKTYRIHQQEAGLPGAIRSLVHRRHETRLAVDCIDLTIDAGEIVGVLGPNGAGKTTTLKMLSGLLYPTSGELSVLGFVPSRREFDYLRQIALVMGQKSFLWWDVPAMETLLLHKEMYALPEQMFRESVAELAELLDVAHLLKVPVRNVSLGERMKLELLAALVHRPRLLFLDEPTIGLDVVAKARVRTFLAELNDRLGTTIIITSHDMDDIEALCRRVVLINHGRIGFDGALAALVRAVQPGKLIRATFAHEVNAGPLVARFGAEVTVVEDDEDDAVLSLAVARDRLSDVLEALPRLGPLVDLSVADAEVEGIVRDLFTRDAPVMEGAS